MKNAILIDFEPNSLWDFDKVISNETNEKWEVLKEVSNLNQGSLFQNIIRYLKYFSFPFCILLKKKQYSKLIAWQQFYGIIYSFYTQLFKISKGPDLYIMTFIYKEKNGVIGILYKKFINYSLKSKFIKQIFVFSNSEKAYYSQKLEIDLKKFSYIRLGVEDYNIEKQETNRCEEKYYLSVGRSNRDYDFLIEHWSSKWGNLKIITDMDIKASFDKTKIEIIQDCYNADYYEYLSNCYAVIIPLADENISSGELVTIQAGMFEKPVISTYNKTLQNYIINGETGFLINKTEIEKYMNLLKNEELYRKMCCNARKNYELKHSLKSMANEITNYL